ncbi:MAG: nucleoside-triphosphatase [Candidatus Pacearchaeota archaeon]
MEKIFITGMPGSGKTTLIKRIMEKTEDYLAIISEEIRKNGKRIGFFIELRDDKKIIEKEILALDKVEEGNKCIKFGRYYVFPKNIDKIVDKAKLLIKEKEIIFIDEIGKMEFYSEKFKKFIEEILKSNIKIFATLHRDFINKFKNYGNVLWLNKNNFNEIFEKIIKNIK